MSTTEERVLQREKERAKAEGFANAQAVQEKSSEMTSDELYAAVNDLPRFAVAVQKENMMNRKADRYTGFICVSTAGNICRLLQNYDSDVFKGEPETLRAQWGRVWSNDPAKAEDFVADANSPFHKGNCCRENGEVFRSKVNDNVHAPSAAPDLWEKVENEEVA